MSDFDDEVQWRALEAPIVPENIDSHQSSRTLDGGQDGTSPNESTHGELAAEGRGGNHAILKANREMVREATMAVVGTPQWQPQGVGGRGSRHGWPAENLHSRR